MNLKTGRHRMIPAGIFLLLSLALIFATRPYLLFFPSQEVKLSVGPAFNPLFRGYIFIQEVTLKQDYINAFELHLNPSSQEVRNRMSVLLLDSSYTIRFRTTLLNEELKNPGWVCFRIPQPVKLGRGSKAMICITSLDGDMKNFALITRDLSTGAGSMCARSIVNDDLLSSIRGAGERIEVQGSAMYKTYESDSNIVWGYRIFWIFLSLGVAALILFGPGLRWLHPRLFDRVRPDLIYLVFSLFFGLVYLLITPPFQVPDGIYHFQSAYWASEYDLKSDSASVPASFNKLTSAYERLRFSMVEKTSLREILAGDTLALHPEKRVCFSQNFKSLFSYYNIFNISFLFPGLGVQFGRWLDLGPLPLMYAGRVANLILSTLLIFLAIRIIPVSKWMVVLTGLMPMTLSLIASNSYWGIRISLSFLLIGMMIYYALRPGKSIRVWEIILLLGITVLLALTRLQYAALGLLILAIPFERKRVAGQVAVLLLLILPAFYGFTWNSLSSGNEHTPDMVTGSSSGGDQQPAGKQDPGPENARELEPGKPPSSNREFVLRYPFEYLKILANTTFNYYKGYYIETFIGRLGWLSVPLPPWMITVYFWMIVAAAIGLSGSRVPLGWISRFLLIFTFVLLWVAIHTVIYIGMFGNNLGQLFITGVAGRYFIPFSPLIFLAMSGNLPEKWINHLDLKRFMGKRQVVSKGNKAIPSAGPSIPGSSTPYQRFSRLLILLCILTPVAAFLVSVYAILTHYYVILL